MQIVRTSRLTGNTSAMNIDITQAQLAAWVDGSLIQDVMPDISADEREFIMTGITPDEWDIDDRHWSEYLECVAKFGEDE